MLRFYCFIAVCALASIHRSITVGRFQLDFCTRSFPRWIRANAMQKSCFADRRAAPLLVTDGDCGWGAWVLSYLEIRGLLESRAGEWRLLPRGAGLLAELPESLIGYYVEAYGSVLNRMSGPLEGSNVCSEIKRGTEALGRRCEVLFRSFGTKLVADLMAEHGARSVVDLGCATGGLVLDLCTQYLGLTGLGLDIATDAIDYANRRAVDRGLAGRASFMVADAFLTETWPRAGVDADFYVMVGALHEHFRDGIAAVVELLRRYADLLASPERTSKTMLAEPELHRDAADADFYLIHALTGQAMPRPGDDWLAVPGDAGLRCHWVFSAPNTGSRFAYCEIQAGLRRR